MHVIRLFAKADPDGVLRLSLPVGVGEYEVAVVLSPKPAANGSVPANTPEARGWPPGYFDRTAGAIQDPAFERGDQGWYEQREPLP
jgi:hypothetical protein